MAKPVQHSETERQLTPCFWFAARSKAPYSTQVFLSGKVWPDIHGSKNCSGFKAGWQDDPMDGNRIHHRCCWLFTLAACSVSLCFRIVNCRARGRDGVPAALVLGQELNTTINKVLIVGSGWVGRQVAARMAAFGVAVALTDKDSSIVADALQWMQQCDFPAAPLTMGHASSPTMGSDSCLSVSNADASVPAMEPFKDKGNSVPWLHLVEPFPAIDQLTRQHLEVWQPDLAIECVPEQLSLKKRVLRILGELVPETCIIASNTSYFVPSVLSQFVKHPERFAHLHFHVPVLRESVADIVGCSSTSPAVLHSLSALCQRIEQYPLVLKREHPGYVFNWLLQSVLKAALELVALDVVDVEEVDRSWKSVTGMPVGPFGMMDQIGLDVIEQVLSNSRWVAPPQVDTQQLLAVLRPLIQGGRLGTKTGSGFYDYPLEE